MFNKKKGLTMRPTNEQIFMGKMRVWKTRRGMEDPFRYALSAIGNIEDTDWYDWEEYTNDPLGDIMHGNSHFRESVFHRPEHAVYLQEVREGIAEAIAWFRNNKHKWE